MGVVESFTTGLSLQLELILRIIIAGILGSMIGFERRNRYKMAGIRTHAIVAFGAALMMIVSKYGFSDIGEYDGARVAAQIVSGIGFLGAGIIVVRNNNSISGLTTAAGIWATAGVGMSIGGGQYLLSICSTVILILMQILLHKVKFLANEPYSSKIKIHMKGSVEKLGSLEEFLVGEKIDIAAIKLNKLNGDTTKLEMDLLFPARYNKILFIGKLAEQTDIISVAG